MGRIYQVYPTVEIKEVIFQKRTRVSTVVGSAPALTRVTHRTLYLIYIIYTMPNVDSVCWLCIYMQHQGYQGYESNDCLNLTRVSFVCQPSTPARAIHRALYLIYIIYTIYSFDLISWSCIYVVYMGTSISQSPKKTYTGGVKIKIGLLAWANQQ